jgi:Tol biopolymer transport system component
MEPKPQSNNASTCKLLRTVCTCLAACSVFLAVPVANAQRSSPEGGDPSAQPGSVLPIWRHLGLTWRASVAGDGTEGNSYVGSEHAISADGRYVVFSSMAWNMVPGDVQYGHQDIFLHDNQTRATERISVSSAGQPCNEDAYYGVDISADGRHVVFATKASNLVSGDTNGVWDIFLRDRTAGSTIRISNPTAGGQSNGNSWQPQISDDGQVIVYASEATNLVLNDTNNRMDIFAYNRVSGQTERVSVSSSGEQGNAAADLAPAVSADGRFVAFTSEATNLVTGDANAFCDMNGDGTFGENCPDVFVRDRTNGTTERVSVSGSEIEGNDASVSPVISGDGRYVAFYSAASNLVSNDTNSCQSWYHPSTPGPCPDVFVRDRTAETTERVSVSSIGGQSTHSSMNVNRKPPAISGDGRYVAFESDDPTLAAGATNGWTQILIHDRITGETTLASASTYGWQGDEWSTCPVNLSGDGRYVAFPSRANNLATDDGNGFEDIYVRDRVVWTYAADGTVRNGSGSPLAGVWVGYGGGVGESKVTDSNGEYELYYMPPGVYSITAHRPGLMPDPIKATVTITDATIKGIDFVMRPPAAIVYLPLVLR